MDYNGIELYLFKMLLNTCERTFESGSLFKFSGIVITENETKSKNSLSRIYCMNVL